MVWPDDAGRHRCARDGDGAATAIATRPRGHRAGWLRDQYSAAELRAISRSYGAADKPTDVGDPRGSVHNRDGAARLRLSPHRVGCHDRAPISAHTHFVRGLWHIHSVPHSALTTSTTSLIRWQRRAPFLAVIPACDASIWLCPSRDSHHVHHRQNSREHIW